VRDARGGVLHSAPVRGLAPISTHKILD
jgi:hypothetical protein